MARRLLAAMVAVGMIAAAVVWRADVGDTVSGWATRLRDLADAEPDTEADLRSLAGQSRSVLVTLGEEEGAVAFVLFVSDPDGPPVALVLPQDLLAAVPGYGEFRLVDAFVFGGSELVALALTNEFGVRIDSVTGLPPGAISGGLFGPVLVDLSVPLFVEGDDGVVDRVLPAGPAAVAPDLVETLLVVAGAGDEFEWIQRQGSAWKSVLDAIAETPAVADRIVSLGVGGTGAADLMVTVAGSEEAILATIPVSSAESVTGADALIPSPDQADDFVRTRFDHLLLRPEGRPRIEILNGNGQIGATADVAAVLVRAGFRIVRTDNADDFDYEDTQVIAQGDRNEATAREVLELVGRGLLFLEVRAPSGVVDVSIIVGQDIPSGEG
jgi:hypothetical protein